MEEKKNSSPFIELVNRFWIVNIECSLETSDIALFFALHHFCNQVGWKRIFACSNRQVMNLIQISDKTLISARKRLVDAGLITFTPGTNKRQKSLYSFCTDYWSYSSSSGSSSGSSNIIREDKTKQELLKNNKKISKINKKSKPKMVEQVSPTLEDVVKICTGKGMSEDEAKNFFYYYDAQGWVTTGGQKIKRIDSMVNRWLSNGKQKAKDNGGYKDNATKKQERNDEIARDIISRYM